MGWVVDRFENGSAVLECLETQETVILTRTLLPIETKEGDVLMEEDGCFRVDHEETTARAQRMRLFLEGLKG